MRADPDRAFKALTPLLKRVGRDIAAVRYAGKPAYWTKQPLTRAGFDAHLGDIWRGVCPIAAGSDRCSVSVLDFDSHKGDTSRDVMLATVQRVVRVAEVDGICFQIFRSSGGNGYHAIALWENDQDTASVRAACVEVLSACGLSNGTGGVAKGQVEVFPKQDSVPLDGNGSMFILPLAGRSVWLDPEWDYEPMDIRGLQWRFSDPVAIVVRAARTLSTSGDVDPERAVSALMSIPNNDVDYDRYRNIGFAVCSALGVEAGLAAFMAWSRQSPKNDERETRRFWRHFKPEKVGGITAGTVFKLAHDAGWERPTADGMPTYEAAAPTERPDPYLKLEDRTEYGNANMLRRISKGDLTHISEVDRLGLLGRGPLAPWR